jgi:predicted DNA-binding transcriptional regulator AlpA
MIDRVISRQETARMLSVSMATFERLERAGVLPRRIQVSQRRFGYLESDLAKYLTYRRDWEALGKPNSDGL